MLTAQGLDGSRRPDGQPLAVASQDPFSVGTKGKQWRQVTFSDCVHLLLQMPALEKHAAYPHPTPGPWLWKPLRSFHSKLRVTLNLGATSWCSLQHRALITLTGGR